VPSARERVYDEEMDAESGVVEVETGAVESGVVESGGGGAF